MSNDDEMQVSNDGEIQVSNDDEIQVSNDDEMQVSNDDEIQVSNDACGGARGSGFHKGWGLGKHVRVGGYVWCMFVSSSSVLFCSVHSRL